MSSLLELPDEKLIEAYYKAVLLKLDNTFIILLEEELVSRGFTDLNNYTFS